MKKGLLAKISALAAAAVLACTCLSACGNETKTVYSLPHYDGTQYGEKNGEENEDPDMTGLWRRNQSNLSMDYADPQIFYNETDGYWYHYYGDQARRTKTFRDTDWDYLGKVVEHDGYGGLWAAEITYDKDRETYYLFTSIAPNVLGDPDGLNLAISRLGMTVFTSKSPDGPFRMLDFTDEESVGESNTRTIDREKYKDDYVKSLLFEPDAFMEKLTQIAPKLAAGIKLYPSQIDAHPYEYNGKKYFYMTLMSNPNAILGIEMENWLKPKYETLTLISVAGYYNVQDYLDGKTASYQKEVAVNVNEGAQVIEHNGKHYLIYSFGAHTSRSYSVGQAVSTSGPLGPYRKLTEDEGGIVLSCDYGRYGKLSATGHHGLFTVNGKQMIAYHRQAVYGQAGIRNTVYDEVLWLPIKDKDGNDLEVMYVNGPTCTVMPRFDAEAEYVDISANATPTLQSGELEKGSDVSWLNDGLLTFNTYINQNFYDKYVQETVVTKDSTFTLTFEKEQAVRGFIIHNSKHVEKAYRKIKDILITCTENGAEKVYYIKELNIDEKQAFVIDSFDNTIAGMVYGYGVYAEFDELNVKSIEFTVEVPEGQKSAAVSEVSIIGKEVA